jgi:hypothetical protein
MPDPALPKTPATPAFDVKDVGPAPIVYFDGATNFGWNNGIVNVTLAANRYLPDTASGGVVGDVIIVSHLRCTTAAAIDLRAALDKALLIGVPTDGQIN